MLAISLLFGLTASAQSPGDEVTPSSINTKYLEHLIKEKVDSVRISLNLKPLANDSTCFLAAKDHSDYMVREKSFSHNQVRGSNKEKPQDRVNFYGGVNYLAGENLGRTYINKRMRDKKGMEYSASRKIYKTRHPDSSGLSFRPHAQDFLHLARYQANMDNPQGFDTLMNDVFDGSPPEGSRPVNEDDIVFLEWK